MALQRFEELRERLNRLAARIERSKARRNRPPRPVDGPGTELKTLLAELGIVPPPTCSCHLIAAEMDRNGSDWCRSNVTELVRKIRKNRKSVKWRTQIRAAWKSIPMLLKWQINPLNPIRSLVLIAIERFEQRTVK